MERNLTTRSRRNNTKQHKIKLTNLRVSYFVLFRLLRVLHYPSLSLNRLHARASLIQTGFELQPVPSLRQRGHDQK